MSEINCFYVSSHGILKSCSLAITTFKEPNMIFNIERLKKGDVLYLDATLVLPFYKKYWKHIKEPIKIVSGNQDITFPEIETEDPDIFNRFLSEPKLIKWFSQNMCLTGPKVEKIPIGLDYHTLANHMGTGHPWGKGIMPVVQEAYLRGVERKPWAERLPVAFCNWHFFADRGDRKEVLEKADKRCFYFVQNYQVRVESWAAQGHFAFVCSPRGGGIDCHRTWEALCLGCVPIVKTSGMDSLWNGLPVWIVNDWSEITPENCQKQKELFAGKQELFNSHKLRLGYWLNDVIAK